MTMTITKPKKVIHRQNNVFPKASKPSFSPLPEPMPMAKRPIEHHDPNVYKQDIVEQSKLYTEKKRLAEANRTKFGTKRPKGRKAFTYVYRSSSSL